MVTVTVAAAYRRSNSPFHAIHLWSPYVIGQTIYIFIL